MRCALLLAVACAHPAPPAPEPAPPHHRRFVEPDSDPFALAPDPPEPEPAPTGQPFAPYNQTFDFGGGDAGDGNGVSADGDNAPDACEVAKDGLYRKLVDTCRGAGLSKITGADRACACRVKDESGAAHCSTDAIATCADHGSHQTLGAAAASGETTATDLATEDARARCAELGQRAVTIGTTSCACTDDRCVCIAVAWCR